jgi:hypothetical protein
MSSASSAKMTIGRFKDLVRTRSYAECGMLTNRTINATRPLNAARPLREL